MAETLTSKPIAEQIKHWLRVIDQNDAKDRGWSKAVDDDARAAIARLHREGFERMLAELLEVAGDLSAMGFETAEQIQQRRVRAGVRIEELLADVKGDT